MERNWALLYDGEDGERVQHSAALTSCRIIPEKLSRGCVVDFLARLRELQLLTNTNRRRTMSWRSGKTTMSEALHVSRLSAAAAALLTFSSPDDDDFWILSEGLNFDKTSLYRE